MLSWNQFVGPSNPFGISGTHQRGSILTGSMFTSPPIVVSYRWSGQGILRWFERQGYEFTCPICGKVRFVAPYGTCQGKLRSDR
jgi:hypothetical protein